MKYRITLFLYIFQLLIANAQITSGKVTYNVLLAIEENETDVYKKAALSSSKRLEYTLTFNQDNSFFQEANKIDDDDFSLRLAGAFAGYINPVFYDKNENYFLYNNKFSPLVSHFEFRIKVTDTIGWKLTNETKIINNYKCFKATSERITFKSDKQIVFPVVAWYCPEIPVPFGPLDCAGLPGLIFELEYQNASFVINKIELNKDVRIEEIKKGQIVTPKEFNDIFNSRFKEASQFLEKN